MSSRKAVHLLIAVLLILAAMLAGCSGSNNDGNKSGNGSGNGNTSAANNGGSSNTGNEDQKEDKPKPVEIVVAGYPQETDTAGRAQWDDKIKRFQEQYPWITVKPDPWQYNPQEFAVKMAGNAAPDVISLFATEGRIVAERGWAADLTEFIQNWELGDEYNPDAFKAFTVNGKIYGMPEWQYVMNILYNKKLFREKGVPEPTYGWTWNDMIEAAKALTDKDKGIAGIGLPGKGAEATWVWSNFLYQAGGEAEELKDGKWLSVANSDAGVKALKLYKDLRWTWDVIQPNTSAGGGDINKDFGNGKIAMITHGDWVVSQMLNEYKMPLEDIGIVPMPSMEPGGPHAAVSGGGYTIINGQIKDPNKLDAAWKWITFDRLNDDGLKSEEQWILDSQAKGEKIAHVVISPVKPDSEYGKKQRELWAKYPDTKIQWPDELYATLLKDAHFEPPIDGQAWYSTFAPAIEKILTDKNADPKTELDTVSKVFQEQTLNQYTN